MLTFSDLARRMRVVTIIRGMNVNSLVKFLVTVASLVPESNRQLSTIIISRLSGVMVLTNFEMVMDDPTLFWSILRGLYFV